MKKEVSVALGYINLKGNLSIPEGATALVIFAHGSGSSRFSPRNNAVADHLNSLGLATFLVDLLTEDEEKIDNVTRELRFDIPLLAGRLVGITDWAKQQDQTKDLIMGYFGASTGAAAALIAAAEISQDIKAVVSRGGRPDLAEVSLPYVHAATLFIVGEQDKEVLSLNEFAFELLAAPKKELSIVPGATHLFEEPGALEKVAELAGQWFKTFLV